MLRKKIKEAKEVKIEIKEILRNRYQNGEIVVAHAEGTRYKEGVRPFKKGIFSMTSEVEEEGIEIPVIPIGIEYENWPIPGSRVYLRAGEPISSKTPNLIETVRKEVARLSNCGIIETTA